MMRQTEIWGGPLAGVRVLDLTRVLAGPFATQILGDLGADVIKVEPPRGDDTRRIGPHRGGESHYFLSINRSKRGMVIDLKQPQGVDLLKRLVKKSDILVENFRPGVMDRFGLGYDILSQINPQLIYCAISGFGLTGPLRDRPSFDIVTQALTGALSVNGAKGEPPVKLGLPMGDMVGGVFGPIAILAALQERQRTGTGRLIDVSLYDGLMGMLGYLPQLAFFTGQDPEPVGTGHPNVAPYGAYETCDGQIIIACLTDEFWRRLARAIGRADLAEDARFTTMPDRRRQSREIDLLIEAFTTVRTIAQVRAVLDANDVPNAPVLGVTAALAEPHSLAREMVVTADHPVLGPIPMVGRPIKFPGSPQAELKAAPTLGQHSDEILRDVLDITDEELAALRADETIR